MGELSNCPECNKLFVRHLRDVCPDCHKEEERKYRTVYDFLKVRKNRQASVLDIVTATGVSDDLIYKFLKEKRLSISQFPNLYFPCEKCGAEINEGKLCSNCKKDLKEALSTQESLEFIAERNRQENQKGSVYYSNKRE